MLGNVIGTWQSVVQVQIPRNLSPPQAWLLFQSLLDAFYHGIEIRWSVLSITFFFFLINRPKIQ